MTERWRHPHCRHPWVMHVCNTHKNVRNVRAVCVHQKNVRATSECVSTHRRTHSGCYYVGANSCEYDPTTQKFSKNSSLHDQLREHLRTSFMFFLISLTETWSANLLFNNYQMYESMFLGFPRHTCRLILDDAFVWYLILSSGSSRSGISNCVRTFVQLPRHIPWECTPVLSIFGISRRSAMSCLNFVSCNSQLNFLLTQTVVLVWVFCMYFSSL